MSPLTVHLLRRLAVLALALAAVLAVGPPVLHELGLVGPTVQEEVEAAARALAAARTYGAADDLAAYAAAARELDKARGLAQRGERRDARRAAAEARRGAIQAQRIALATREEGRRRAAAVVNRIDKILNELEDLYAQITPGLEKPTVSRLFSLMKGARQTGALLVLANEQGNYSKVIEEEQGTAEVLLSVKQELAAARRGPGAGGDRSKPKPPS